ncbi:specifically androgen-regulated gene protein isoform X2 [Mastacembelus armatus]|nr:specifically androgen-regulated gene protein-like isoform X2 [Mastacembelus armatus]XP_026187146.1 specifically androgen-regulated gene protein-like isoform X2 [Mastacembelus armatus]XP_026187147.1 specifically androgen-regulated gene protein-like isoform X2 [Mastacembelus armatus]
MEYLSPEERACLMYLEETIEALEVQEDSGLSNDEPDAGLQAEKMGWTTANDISSFKDESRMAEHHVQNHRAEPQSSAASPPADTKALMSIIMNFKTKPKPPPDTQTKVACEDGNPKVVTGSEISPDQSTKAPETDLGLIPPPSDFMDEPAPLPQPDKVKAIHSSPGISSHKPGATVDLDQLCQRASTKRTSMSSSVVQENSYKPQPEVPPSVCQPPVTISPQKNPLPEAVETRSPPSVAPKPTKLPANIILKSQKAGSDGNSGHLFPTGSDRVLMDPQKVRTEALRKLGLLKTDEFEPGPALSPKHSPNTRWSWASPPSPVSAGALNTPPSTPFNTHVSSPPLASHPLQPPAAVSLSANSAPPAVKPRDIFPVPSAFRDSGERLSSDNEHSAVRDVSEAKINAEVNTPPLTPPIMAKQFTPPRITSVKSATLERSGLGLSSYMISHESSEVSQGVSGEQSPSQLRNNRPRPASLGSKKEFSSTQGEGLQTGHAPRKELIVHRPLPGPTAFQHPGPSQKLPRSQGISVLICPRSENDEDRRKALKKLGLLRD